MSDAKEINLSQIGQIAVNVHDLDKAVTFYRDVLGMTFLFHVPPNIAFFNCGDIRLMRPCQSGRLWIFVKSNVKSCILHPVSCIF